MNRFLPGLFALLGLALGMVPTANTKSHPDLAALGKGNNQFALDLYGQLRGEEGNLFFSPLVDISSALFSVSADHTTGRLLCARFGSAKPLSRPKEWAEPNVAQTSWQWRLSR